MLNPPLKNCCLCINLPFAGFVIGTLQIGYHTITLICLAVWLRITQEVDEAIIGLLKQKRKSYQQYEVFGQISAITFWPIIIWRVILLATSICLIVGTQKRNNHWILPYLIFEGISIGVLALYCLGAAANESRIGNGVAVFIVPILCIGLNFYFWLCILSLYLSNEQLSDLDNDQAMIPLQTIPEHQIVYLPPNNEGVYHPPQQM